MKKPTSYHSIIHYDMDEFGGLWGGQGSVDVSFVKEESKLMPKEDAKVEGKEWRRYSPGKSADVEESYMDIDESYIDLDRVFEMIDFAVAYLGVYVYSPVSVNDYILHVGSDDYMKIYINEEFVHTYNTQRRGAAQDQDTVTSISLKKGWNKVVVKLSDVVDLWGIYLRFADSGDRPIKVFSHP